MTATMLAARLDPATRHFAVTRVPVPEPADGEVRVAVRAAGVCLSDLHLIDGTLPVTGGPLTLGHEVAGVVDKVGAKVPSAVSAGQRVLLQAGEPCGACQGCLRRGPCRRPRTRGVNYDGGWAEYALARCDTIVAIPDDLPFDQAAILPDAVSTPYAAIVATAEVRPAQSAGVWGAEPITIGNSLQFSVQRQRILGHYGSQPHHVEELVVLARHHRLDLAKSISGHIPLADAPEAVQRLAGKVGDPVRLILVP